MDRRNSLQKLRRQMGWTTSDLARHLGCGVTDLETWETGKPGADAALGSRIEFLFRQADVCRDEVKRSPQAENFLDESDLDQVDGDRVKERELR